MARWRVGRLTCLLRYVVEKVARCSQCPFHPTLRVVPLPRCRGPARHISIDIGHHFGYIPNRISLMKDAFGRQARRLGRVRCLRAELRSAPGRFRASAAQHYGLGREVLAGLGQVGAGNARTNCVGLPPEGGRLQDRRSATSQEAWPEAEPRDRKLPWAEPWWNADRRARPQRRVGASRRSRGASRTRWCGHETLRLSAFHFLFFLISPLPRSRGERSSEAKRTRVRGLSSVPAERQRLPSSQPSPRTRGEGWRRVRRVCS